MIKTLDDLLNSREYDSMRFGSSSDDWFYDAERMERVTREAIDGGDGSTHGEHIQDWRDCLELLELSDDVRLSIQSEIDDCEEWHTQNGTINDIVG